MQVISLAVMEDPKDATAGSSIFFLALNQLLVIITPDGKINGIVDGEPAKMAGFSVPIGEIVL